MKVIFDFINAVNERVIPQDLRECEVTVEASFVDFTAFSDACKTPIYGVHTLPGHLDHVLIADLDGGHYQEQLILSHAIGGPPYFDPRTVSCITLAKLYSGSRGNTLVSGTLWGMIARAFETPSFAPDVPLLSSYSCGNVIPAAHWARALLEWGTCEAPYSLKRGEGMALINGAFVHIGAAADLSIQLRDFWVLYLKTLRISLQALNVDRRLFGYDQLASNPWSLSCCEYIARNLGQVDSRQQYPVSVRATVQSIDALTGYIEVFFETLDSLLQKPSGNPLFFGGSRPRTVSCAAFLSPSLTIATSALVEALLMAAWCCVERIRHLVARNQKWHLVHGRTDGEKLGLIQWPKNAQAKLEGMRRVCGCRSFVSGSSTSEGIEDFWSHGLSTTQSAREALQALTALARIELYCAQVVTALGSDGDLDGFSPAIGADGTPDETVARRIADALIADHASDDVPFLS